MIEGFFKIGNVNKLIQESLVNLKLGLVYISFILSINLSTESIAVSSMDEFINADKISKLELFNKAIFKSPIDAVANDIALLYANSNSSASLLFSDIVLLNST